jgi:two-component system OmpR family sensor kinase
MNHLRTRSIRQARRQTLAEHRRFLSRLDHELKNPLTALQVGVKTLALTNLDERQAQIVATLEAETSRLSRLVTDLRKLAELETQPLNLQPVNLHVFVADMLQAERERFEAARRTLTAGVSAGQDVWTFDQDLLVLAIHNLLDNALKYSRPGDAVRMDISAQQELLIRISDTGIGIPSAALAHVWEELYRAHQIEKTSGSGIGLALVKAIVERHDGTAHIESRLDQGTTVTLRLPPVSQD